jgi:hypothetical protein
MRITPSYGEYDSSSTHTCILCLWYFFHISRPLLSLSVLGFLYMSASLQWASYSYSIHLYTYNKKTDEKSSLNLGGEKTLQ